jgi:hypothetical protein
MGISDRDDLTVQSKYALLCQYVPQRPGGRVRIWSCAGPARRRTPEGSDDRQRGKLVSGSSAGDDTIPAGGLRRQQARIRTVHQRLHRVATILRP